MIGIDEVGRGAIAGPVAVGVVLLDKQNPSLNNWPENLQDSKLMTAKSRKSIHEALELWVSNHQIGYSENIEIDQLGISEALRLAASRALSQLFLDEQLKAAIVKEGCVVLLDGTHNWLGKHAAGLEVDLQAKADVHCVSVAGAAVLAKLARDQLMEELDVSYPEYGFAGHKGYASKAHIEAIKSHGPSPIHRLTWLTRILA